MDCAKDRYYGPLGDLIKTLLGDRYVMAEGIANAVMEQMRKDGFVFVL